MIFKCKMCGATLEVQPGETVARCAYCDTPQTLPRLSDERSANLYDRAGHFRRNNEFDKAAAIYESILADEPSDAEAYWSLVLCRYGIEYVQDPATKRRLPTVNRAQFTSVFDDENYKAALQYADAEQRKVYEAEAEAINEIQRGILAISQKEEPFDVFVCYKETDQNGRRTHDSVLAQELYYQLKQEGFRVFFARITLEDKLGTAYEPYIFAALQSAKVMVVLGTEAAHFNAVWVKNEWSRYLALIKNGAKKVLIPAYRDMDPYDLPEEFSHLQAQDMSKLGFMQDLVRGIKKIVGAAKESPAQAAPAAPAATAAPVAEPIAPLNANISALLRRATLFLEDGEFDRADDFCEQVLNQDPENGEAYLCKLLAELELKSPDLLAKCETDFTGSGNYQKVLRFGNENLKKRLLDCADKAFERRVRLKLQEIDQQEEGDALQEAELLVTYVKKHTDRLTASDLLSVCERKAEQLKEEITKKAEEKNKQEKKETLSMLAFCVGCAVFLLIVFMIAAFAPSCSSSAKTKTIDGIEYTKEGKTYVVTGYDAEKMDANVVIPAEIKGKPVVAIADNAFKSCDSLKTVKIPDEVTSIGGYSFYNCGNLSAVVLSENSRLTTVGKNAFASCDNITSIFIPASVTSIREYAFCFCSKLLTVNFGKNSQLASIEKYAFANCGITSIIVPKGVVSIGEYAFSACVNLSVVTFDNNSQLTTIGERAFTDCDCIASITIPKQVTSIGAYAFYGCKKLETVTFEEPNGWKPYIPGTTSENVFSATVLSTKSTAAMYLKSIYSHQKWKRNN